MVCLGLYGLLWVWFFVWFGQVFLGWGFACGGDCTFDLFCGMWVLVGVVGLDADGFVGFGTWLLIYFVCWVCLLMVSLVILLLVGCAFVVLGGLDY